MWEFERTSRIGDWNPRRRKELKKEVDIRHSGRPHFLLKWFVVFLLSPKGIGELMDWFLTCSGLPLKSACIRKEHLSLTLAVSHASPTCSSHAATFVSRAQSREGQEDYFPGIWVMLDITQVLEAPSRAVSALSPELRPRGSAILNVRIRQRCWLTLLRSYGTWPREPLFWGKRTSVGIIRSQRCGIITMKTWSKPLGCLARGRSSASWWEPQAQAPSDAQASRERAVSAHASAMNSLVLHGDSQRSPLAGVWWTVTVLILRSSDQGSAQSEHRIVM